MAVQSIQNSENYSSVIIDKHILGKQEKKINHFIHALGKLI